MARGASADTFGIPLEECELAHRTWEDKSCVVAGCALLMSGLLGCRRNIRLRSCGDVRSLGDGIGRGACALTLARVASGLNDCWDPSREPDRQAGVVIFELSTALGVAGN